MTEPIDCPETNTSQRSVSATNGHSEREPSPMNNQSPNTSRRHSKANGLRRNTAAILEMIRLRLAANTSPGQKYSPTIRKERGHHKKGRPLERQPPVPSQFPCSLARRLYLWLLQPARLRPRSLHSDSQDFPEQWRHAEASR